MQDCFRQYPEVYGAELDDDDDDEVSDVPPPAPEAFENSPPDTTESPRKGLVTIAPEDHEEPRQSQGIREVTYGTPKTQLAPENPKDNHPVDNEIKNEDAKSK